MNNKVPKRLLVAAVLTTLAVSTIVNAQEYNGGTRPNGGAIDNTAGSTVISVEDGSVFTNNTATADHRGGGAIYNAAQGHIEIGDNVRFESNYLKGVSTPYAGTAGGAISSWDGSSIEIGSGAQFTNNGYTDSSLQTIGGGSGGAIYVSGGGNGTDPQGSLTIGEEAVFRGNATNGAGGAIYAEGSSVTIGSGSVFEGNLSTSGGAVYNYQYNNVESTVEVGDNVSFINNEVTDNSGGAVANFGGTFETGKDTVFSGNTAGYGGGAIRNAGTATIGAGSQFINNTSKANDGYGGGGAIDSSGTITINGGYTDTDGNVHNTIFSGNTAVSGGAIFSNGTTNLAATDGDILFTGNTDATGKNDIFVNTDSSVNLSGSNDISIGSGISGAETIGNAQINNNGANLILEEGSVNAGYTGVFNQTSGSADVKSEFFGGTNNLNGGSVIMEEGASFVAGSTVNVNSGSTVEMQNNSTVNSGAAVNVAGGDMTIATDSNVSVSGTIAQTAGNLINNGNLTITGENASLTGNLTQNYSGATLTVSNGASLDIDQLAAGTLKIDGGVLADNLAITNAVDLEISGITTIDGIGLKVGENYITNAGGSSLNLSGNYLVDGGVLGTSVIISNGSINAVNPEGPITIANPNKLTLSDNATSDNGFKVTDGTLQLAPTEEGTLNLGANNAITGNGSVVVEQIVVQNQVTNPDYDPDVDPPSEEFMTETIGKGVGTINIASDNRDFIGTYAQNDGTVVVQNGGVFFGGTNTIDTVEDSVYTGTYHGGELVLENGSLLASDVTLNGNANADVMDLASVMFKDEVIGTGEDGALTQADIASGVFEHAAINDGTANVNVSQAGAVFANGQTFDEDISLASGSGVRLIGFADGSGVNGNITLADSTGLLYMDGALIKDDSSLNMTNADLIFANNENISYNPEITGSGTISMYGSGTTSVASSLNENINVVSENGVLNLDNKATTAVGNVTAYDGAINLKADNVTVKDVNVSGSTGSASFSGNVTSSGTATVQDGGTLNLIGQSEFAKMTLANGNLNTMGNNAINTVTVDNLNLSANSNILFDVDPRTSAMDSINATTITNNSGNTVLVSGINFTQSPIDRNVTFDITNLIQENGQGQSNLVRLPDGGVVANSAMGQYLITSQGGASPILDASLLSLNPQMYRGQVATIASWQNQLLVNNLLFDHMNLVTRKLMDEERTANKYAAAVPQIDPYQYSIQDGSLWFKAYGAFETLSMTKGLNVGNNAYGSLIGADFPLINLKNGWKLVPTAYIGYNGAHQHFNGVSMYQNGAQLGIMGTAYKGDFMTSLLAYGGGYANDMTVRGQYGGGSDTTGNWFAGVASKSAYNIRLPHDFIIQPAFMAAYNAFGQQNWGSDFGNMSMSAGMLNGLNIAPGLNFIWQKETFSIYAVTQLVYNVMGGVDGKAGNIDLGYVRMRHCYFEYGLGVMKKFKDRFSGYLQFTIRNGGRTGIGFSGGLQWKIGK